MGTADETLPPSQPASDPGEALIRGTSASASGGRAAEGPGGAASRGTSASASGGRAAEVPGDGASRGTSASASGGRAAEVPGSVEDRDPRHRATIHDVAARAGVSIATVSRALRGLPNVARATRARVAAAAEALEYEAHPAAAVLASGRPSTVGIVIPWPGTWYSARVLAGLSEVCSPAGYGLLALDLGEDDVDRWAQRAASIGLQVDALGLVDLELPDGAAEDLVANLDRPVAALAPRSRRFPTVAVDNEGSAYAAGQHLTELGHRRIAVIRGNRLVPNGVRPSDARARGVARALQAVGAELDPALVLDCDDTPDAGRDAARALMGSPQPPTAIFASSDQLAVGALAAMHADGVAVPGDVSIVGFDDHDFAEVLGLTTVRQDVHALGRALGELLLGQLTDPDTVSDHTVMATELVVRSSTGPAR